jgi:uncharacterized protein (DUF4213/DUF364 family)
MARKDLLREVKGRFVAELESRSSSSESLGHEVVVSRPLHPKEAIGDPGRDDFAILRGKEVLMQAVFRGAAGQAFTAAEGSFKGSLGDVLELSMGKAFERAVLIATMNAVLRYFNLIEGTVHCKDTGPKRCADCMAEWIRNQDADKVGLIGMQPALLVTLAKTLGINRVLVSDMAEAGKIRSGIKILDGMDSHEIFERCQLILITGSTLANGTIDGLMEMALDHDRRVVFFGTTIAGAAFLLGLERWCPCSI